MSDQIDNRFADARVIDRGGRMMVVIGQREMNVNAAAALAGLSASVVRARLQKGWEPSEALTRPAAPMIATGQPGDRRGARRRP
jgi:hypothetical protein